MKWILGLLFITLFLSFTNNKETNKKRDKTLPGTVRLNDSLFIDECEMTNIGWREYLYWKTFVREDSIAILNSLIDTSVWNRFSNSELFGLSEYYHNHPMYNYYPVVGISYEQAVAYCKWRGDRVNELYINNPKKNLFPIKNINTDCQQKILTLIY
jgi:formylglycine-generating enzyme required for sulfatase activity